MENFKQSGRNLPPPTAQYRLHSVLPQQSTETPPKNLSGSLNSRGLKHWLGGMVNNPTTGALSHDKVWANICAGTMTWQFCHSDPTEWQWWAYGGMVGGYGLARRAIAAIQQTKQQQKGNDE